VRRALKVSSNRPRRSCSSRSGDHGDLLRAAAGHRVGPADGPSLALGTGEVTLELTAAYSAFATTGGSRHRACSAGRGQLGHDGVVGEEHHVQAISATTAY
jgi:membrane carboxypeptidase/penicillin-binding protein PbpC